MGSVTREDAISFANRLAAKCQMPQRVETVQEINSDFVLLIYYAVMGELPKDIFTESRSRDAQVHNLDCIVEILATDYLHTNLSHISSKKIVQGDPTNIFNLLEILDGLLDFMLEHATNSDNDEQDVASTSGDDKDYHYNYLHEMNEAANSRREYSSIITKEKIVDSEEDDFSFHKLNPATSPTISDISSTKSGTFQPLTRSLKDISISSVEGELKPTRKVAKTTGKRNKSLTKFAPLEPDSFDSEESSAPRRYVGKYDKVPAKKNLISRFESLALNLNDTFEAVPPPKEVVDDRRKCLWKSAKDEYSSSSGGGVDVCDGDGEESGDDKEGGENLTASDDAAAVGDRLEPKTDDKKAVTVEEDVNQVSVEDQSAANDKEKKTPEDSTADPGVCHETNLPSCSKRNDEAPPKKDWQTLMDNLQQTVEESRRIREKYYSSPMSRHKESDTNGAETKSSSSSSSNDGSLIDKYCSVSNHRPHYKGERKVRFDDDVDVSSPAIHRNMDDEVEQEFDNVLRREHKLQDIKNKLLECSYLNQLEDVNAAERKRLEPLRMKAAHTEDKLRATIAKERQMKKHSHSHLNNVRRTLAANAKWKGCCVPVVRNVPQRRHGVGVKKKVKPHLEIGEHDLLPTLLAEFPGLQLSKPVLDNAWRKQFRQIENLTKMESSHETKKRASNLKLQEAHQCHQLLTDIMRREHEQTQRVREARARENSKRSAQGKAKERRQQTARIRRYYTDYQLQMRSKMMRRRTREEKIFKHLFEEGLDIQKTRLRELRKYAKDKREQLQNHQRNQIASLENYYRDQFQVLAESLKQEKEDLNVRDKAQTQLVRQMKAGLRAKMEREIEDLQELIMRDDDDAHFREIEADRVRRQLQLATYHSRFKPHANI